MRGAISISGSHLGTRGLWLCFCLLGIAGCITVEGESSGQIKEKLENSFLIRSADLFYPDGVPEDPATLPELRSKQVREIEKVFVNFLNAVVTAKKKRGAERQDLFGDRLSDDFRVRLELTNTGQPIAYIDPEGGQTDGARRTRTSRITIWALNLARATIVMQA